MTDILRNTWNTIRVHCTFTLREVLICLKMNSIVTNNDSSRPFANLDPDRIIHAVETQEFRCDGHVLALNSYENRVYQIGIEGDSPVIAKFYRNQRWTDQQIQEEHDFSVELEEAELPVITPLQNKKGESLFTFDAQTKKPS